VAELKISRLLIVGAIRRSLRYYNRYRKSNWTEVIFNELNWFAAVERRHGVGPVAPALSPYSPLSTSADFG